jgi:DNA-binding PadR family transcriptional regulator
VRSTLARQAPKVYRITDAGREELASRREELAELETDISGSVHGLAREIHEEVRGSVRDLKQELKQAAREMRREQRHENRSRRDHHDHHHRDWWDEGECAAILDDAFERIRQTLKTTDDSHRDHQERP